VVVVVVMATVLWVKGRQARLGGWLLEDVEQQNNRNERFQEMQQGEMNAADWGVERRHRNRRSVAISLMTIIRHAERN
jgi:hypothetical protein